MAMTAQENHLSTALIASDPGIAHALTYLFVVVLEHQFDTYETERAALLEMDALREKDVVFLHVPRLDEGWTRLIKALKALENGPTVIVLQDLNSAVGVHAFLAGADDVVTWPCSLHELALRFSVRTGHAFDRAVIGNEDLNWETEAYIADRANLTTSEAQVLRVLYSRNGQIVSRDDLSHAVDSRPWRYGDRKFDVHVAKIRKKLTDAFGTQLSVSTIRSLGYRLSTDGLDLFGTE